MFFLNKNKEPTIPSHTRLTIKTHLCPQNHHCPSVRICPVGALSQIGFNAPTVNLKKCIKCGKCVRFCPKNVFVFL